MVLLADTLIEIQTSPDQIVLGFGLKLRPFYITSGEIGYFSKGHFLNTENISYPFEELESHPSTFSFQPHLNLKCRVFVQLTELII